MYLEACLQKHRYFLPLVAYVDGILDVDAAATLKRIASLLTKVSVTKLEDLNIRQE